MGLDSTAAAPAATTTTTTTTTQQQDARKSLTLPAGRISLKLPLGDRDAARTQFLSLGTPSSPTSSTSVTSVAGSLNEPLTLPFSHKNPNHAVNAFNALNQMRANNEVGCRLRCQLINESLTRKQSQSFLSNALERKRAYGLVKFALITSFWSDRFPQWIHSFISRRKT